MNFLVKNEKGVIEFDRYFEYIGSLKNKLPPAVYDFAKNWDMYSLDAKSSLHDCWMNNFSISEIETTKGKRILQASINLLGAYHDRIISICYTDVSSYNFYYKSLQDLNKGHGDLVIHEIRLNEDNKIEHEILFSNGSCFVICFGDIKIEEAPVISSTF